MQKLLEMCFQYRDKYIKYMYKCHQIKALLNGYYLILYGSFESDSHVYPVVSGQLIWRKSQLNFSASNKERPLHVWKSTRVVGNAKECQYISLCWKNYQL